MRLSRPCYDKPHRCPSKVGGGTRFTDKPSYCKGGYVFTRSEYKDFPGEYRSPGAAPWRFGHCEGCDVVTWPYVLRWLDWRYVWGWKIQDIPRRFRYWRQDRRTR